jgi:hypothetical protein
MAPLGDRHLAMNFLWLALHMHAADHHQHE